MTAAAFVEFDPKPLRLGTVINFIAASAILKGHVVGFAASGTSWTVAPATGGTAATGITPVGVALYGAAAGEKVAVACMGSIVRCFNALSDTTLVDAGDFVVAGATAGMVTVKPANTDCIVLGIALGDIGYGVSNVGYVLITGPVYIGAGE